MGNCQNNQQTDLNLNPNSSQTSHLRITNYIWQQDYQGLFDFDTKEVKKKVLKIQGSAILVKRKDTKYEIFPQNIQKLAKNDLADAVFRVLSKEKGYQVQPVFFDAEGGIGVNKLLWAVVSTLPKQGHRLQEKDIIKLGKQKLRIRQICQLDSTQPPTQQIPKLSKTVYQILTFNPNLQKPLPTSQTIQKAKQSSGDAHLSSSPLSEQTNNEQVCRICLDPGEYNNPLITPCKCSGSVRYIHLGCLRMWLAKRLNVQKGECCVTINWMPLACQMCKAGFRYRIFLDNKKFYTVDIPKPPKPYITVELMKRNSAGNGKIFHFISFASKTKIMLGRRKDIDVRISEDISISRAHACIQYVPNKKSFVLSDNKSKFGTLLLIKKGLLVKPEYKNISIQLGAQIFSFETVKKINDQKNDAKKQQKQEAEEAEEYLAENESEDEDDDDQDDEDIEDNNEEGDGPTNRNISGVGSDANVNANGSRVVNINGNANVN